MQLETLSTHARHPVYLPLGRGENNILQSDWEPLLDVIANQDRDPAERAEIFHASLAQLIVQQARRVRQQHDVDQVGLCGGVFQNRVLTEQAIDALQRRGFMVYLPEKLPVNDAALCYGQAAHFAARKP
jgi:hydrogenase maturation protein HypF